ncbi:flagellar protein [Methylobacterium symbioticum]|uniref:Uncharacterized protein n=1 Tax=Methylobacterium symbioticum TaxID=2584084 RepID=A0A509E9F0_9HYPH|nr:flagellar protein [Methylobacterium symbioticum]VUD70837.1 hypothetical protein MET9862_01411 [Methylobacterium symbioticum]
MQIAASGMAGANLRLTAASEQVARIDAGPSGTGLPDERGLPEATILDLSPTAIGLVEAGSGREVNTIVARAADETTRLLDMKA